MLYGWLKSPRSRLHAGLLGNPAGAASHVWWDGSTHHDVYGLPWAAVGALTQVPAAGGMPAGASGWSGSKYLQLDPLGTGEDVLDFAGDFYVCAIFSPSAYASGGIVVSNGLASTSGYQFAFGGNGTSYGMIKGLVYAAGGVGLNRPNIACIGRSGTTISVQLNGGVPKTMTTTIVTGVTQKCRIGLRGDGNVTFPGTIYEALYVAATPPASNYNAITWAFMAPRKATTFAAIGDSITYADSLKPYATTLQETLGSTWIAANWGVVARQTDVMLTDWTNQMRGGPWALVSIMGGVNDLNNSSRTAAQIFANLEAMADQAAADGAKVILHSITPFGGFSTWNLTKEGIRDDVNDRLAAKAAANPTTMVFIDHDPTMEDPATHAMLAGLVQADGAHPNQAGQDQIATDTYAPVHALGWW